MKTAAERIAVGGWAVFLISLLLPAVTPCSAENEVGWQLGSACLLFSICFIPCAMSAPLIAMIGVANLVLVVSLPTFYCVKKRHSSVAFSALIVGGFFIALSAPNEPRIMREFEPAPGYYLWTLAFLLEGVAACLKTTELFRRHSD
jgi:hypothetical protein